MAIGKERWLKKVTASRPSGEESGEEELEGLVEEFFSFAFVFIVVY